jgi:hypothetical protein
MIFVIISPKANFLFYFIFAHGKVSLLFLLKYIDLAIYIYIYIHTIINKNFKRKEKAVANSGHPINPSSLKWEVEIAT